MNYNNRRYNNDRYDRDDRSKKPRRQGKFFDNVPNSYIRATIATQTCTVPIPIATRGIGLCLYGIARRLTKAYPGIKIDINAAYRCCMAALETKLYIAQSAPRILYHDGVTVPIIATNTALFDICKANPMSLSPIATIINSVGNSKVYDTMYTPVLTYQAAPMNNVYSNLRDYVVSIAVDGAAGDRMRGFRLNSIPGAIFTFGTEEKINEATLSNPDVIIPPDHNASQLRHDFLLFSTYCQAITRKCPSLAAEINYTESGTASYLVSTHLIDQRNFLSIANKLENDVYTYPEFIGDELRFFWSNTLSETIYANGILSLLGEYYEIEEGRIEASNCIRSQYVAQQSCYFSWKTLFAAQNIFASKTIVERTQPATRQSVKQDAYMCHVYVRSDNLGGVLIADHEYPQRVAHTLITKVLDEFNARVGSEQWETGTEATINFTQLPVYLTKYQDPKEADAMTKMQNDLDETKIILKNTIEAVLERGEKLDDMVVKSENLSIQSKAFYKTAKKTNSCCSFS